ncbi:RNA-binding S4 domain-containing protein [Wandonia haliotis]|uniref:RNA-binding S4 domain-containing protein n=1 Tax=Wandonia haliotis TaxID=574963 RepID=A0ABN1MPI3_9FLAO
MQKIEFSLRGEEFIELNKLLKILQIAQTGGHAKLLIQDGIISLNGETESRIRAKLRASDVINVEDEVEILIVE